MSVSTTNSKGTKGRMTTFPADNTTHTQVESIGCETQKRLSSSSADSDVKRDNQSQSSDTCSAASASATPRDSVNSDTFDRKSVMSSDSDVSLSRLSHSSRDSCDTLLRSHDNNAETSSGAGTASLTAAIDQPQSSAEDGEADSVSEDGLVKEPKTDSDDQQKQKNGIKPPVVFAVVALAIILVGSAVFFSWFCCSCCATNSDSTPSSKYEDLTAQGLTSTESEDSENQDKPKSDNVHADVSQSHDDESKDVFSEGLEEFENGGCAVQQIQGEHQNKEQVENGNASNATDKLVQKQDKEKKSNEKGNKKKKDQSDLENQKHSDKQSKTKDVETQKKNNTTNSINAANSKSKDGKKVNTQSAEIKDGQPKQINYQSSSKSEIKNNNTNSSNDKKKKSKDTKRKKMDTKNALQSETNSHNSNIQDKGKKVVTASENAKIKDSKTIKNTLTEAQIHLLKQNIDGLQGKLKLTQGNLSEATTELEKLQKDDEYKKKSFELESQYHKIKLLLRKDTAPTDEVCKDQALLEELNQVFQESEKEHKYYALLDYFNDIFNKEDQRTLCYEAVAPFGSFSDFKDFEDIKKKMQEWKFGIPNPKNENCQVDEYYIDLLSSKPCTQGVNKEKNTVMIKFFKKQYELVKKKLQKDEKVKSLIKDRYEEENKLADKIATLNEEMQKIELQITVLKKQLPNGEPKL